MKKLHLLLIDPQNSFCKVVPQNEQQIKHDGELCVPGAWEDMVRCAKLIETLDKKLNDIHITLDSHHSVHIAHPIWFKNNKGVHPNPFTIMREQNGVIIGSSNGIDVGEFTTTNPSFLKRTLEYLRTLKSGGRYPHCIWTEHCKIGSIGAAVVDPIFSAISNWCNKNFALVDFVTKGSNIFTEHFGAVKAEVPDPSDPSTQLNTSFIQTLMEADEILLAGEALNFCCANTILDIANEFPDGSFSKKLVLLTDCSSEIKGFEQLTKAFMDRMSKDGMRTTTSKDYLF